MSLEKPSLKLFPWIWVPRMGEFLVEDKKRAAAKASGSLVLESGEIWWWLVEFEGIEE